MIFGASAFSQSVSTRFMEFFSTNHPWLDLKSRFESRDLLLQRPKQMLLNFGLIFNSLLLSLIVIRSRALDDGTCEAFATIDGCLSPTLLGNDRYCSWNAASQYCFFQESAISFRDLLLIAIIIIVLSTPFDEIIRFLVEESRQYYLFKLFSHRKDVLKVFVDVENPTSDRIPLEKIALIRSKFLVLLAAKVFVTFLVSFYHQS